MAKNAFSDWSSTASDNTDVGGISLAEGVMLPSAVNNALREIMAQLKSGVGTIPFTTASASGPAKLAFAEDTDNGTSKATLQAPSALGADVIVTLPSSTGTLALTSDITTPAMHEVGDIVFTSGSTLPTKCLWAYGQNVSRTTYSAYFALVGTTYGSGDGSTTFAMPDYRGRVIAGKDNMGGTSANRLTNQTGGLNGDTLGATGGAETHTLTTAQLAQHAHGQATGGTGSTVNGNGAAAGVTSTGGASSTGSAGSDAAHNNVQPTAIANIAIYVGV